MGNKAIKRKAEEHLGRGMPKRQVFDLLMAEFPEAQPKKVAEVLRYMPTLQARERYRSLHRLLMAAIALHAVLRVLRPALDADFVWADPSRIVGVVPFATLLLGYSVYRWRGQLFEWVGWMNVIGAYGAIKVLQVWQNGGGDAWRTVYSLLPVGIGALALYLAHKVFAKPKVERDPVGQRAKRYVFPEEGMM